MTKESKEERSTGGEQNPEMKRRMQSKKRTI